MPVVLNQGWVIFVLLETFGQVYKDIWLSQPGQAERILWHLVGRGQK